MDKQVQITAQNIKAFEKAYNECKTDVFDFEGQTILKSYAKYVLEYFSGQGYVLMSASRRKR